MSCQEPNSSQGGPKMTEWKFRRFPNPNEEDFYVKSGNFETRTPISMRTRRIHEVRIFHARYRRQCSQIVLLPSPNTIAMCLKVMPALRAFKTSRPVSVSEPSRL